MIPAPNLHRLIDKAHEGKWAAISADHKRLVAVSDDLLTLEKEVRGQAVTVFKVMPSDVGVRANDRDTPELVKFNYTKT